MAKLSDGAMPETEAEDRDGWSGEAIDQALADYLNDGAATSDSDEDTSEPAAKEPKGENIDDNDQPDDSETEKDEDSQEPDETPEDEDKSDDSDESDDKAEPEGEEVDQLELEDGRRIAIDDIVSIIETMQTEDGNLPSIEDIKTLVEAGKNPKAMITSANEKFRQAKEIRTERDEYRRKAAELEQQIADLQKKAVREPDPSLLDSNPAEWQKQMVAYAAAQAKAGQTQPKTEWDVQAYQASLNAAQDEWLKNNSDFTDGLSEIELANLEQSVVETIQATNTRATPELVKVVYDAKRAQLEGQKTATSVVEASQAGAKAEQRKRARIIRVAKSQAPPKSSSAQPSSKHRTGQKPTMTGAEYRKEIARLLHEGKQAEALALEKQILSEDTF